MGVTVLGTDTEVGKTYQSALLLRELTRRNVRSGAYKPVASGVPRDQQLRSTSSDGGILHSALDGRWPLELICPQQFIAPLAPPLAAKLDGTRVDEQQVISGAEAWCDHCDFLVIETAGGPLSPVSEQWTSLDLAKQFAYPTILVAANRLGCVSQTLLAIEAIHNRGLHCIGVVLNELPTIPTADPARNTPASNTAATIEPTESWLNNRAMILQFGPGVRVEATIDALCDAALQPTT